LAEKEDLNFTLISLKQADQKVLGKLYEIYYERLCVFLLNYCQDRALVEDIVQDVFISIWTNRKKLDINITIKNYLYRSAYNKLIDNYRKQKTNNKLLSSYYYTATMMAIDVDTDYKNELFKKLDECIKELPSRCKQIFCSAKLENLKYKEIAEQLNISLKTVEGHITRGYGLLKDCLYGT
jgi:RNA polymerase sigma-70 factor (ECF subfamily)